MLEINKIHLGDCLELMNDIKDKSIDMILCDLPYGTTKAKWDKVIPFKPLWKQYERITKDNGAIILFAKQPFTTDLINSNRKMFKYTLVWDKKFAGNFANAKKMPLITHEDICVFYKKLPTYNPQMIKREKPIKTTAGTTPSKTTNYGINNSFKDIEKTYDKKYPISILKFKRKLGQKVLHPTEKSEELYKYLIETYTNKDELVLDNCCGSGTIGVAKVIGRNFIGIEKDENFYKTACERVEEFI